MSEFAAAVLAYFREHARDLPWRQSRNGYPIWVSEIMLQQTRVATVIPYYQRWMKSFPTIAALAAAEEDDVLAHWSGLGYYSRARNLHRGAQDVVSSHGGSLPRTASELIKLPGIGRYTAGAVASQAYGEQVGIVDGNIARVFARVFAIEEDIKSGAGQRRLWTTAERLVDKSHPGNYNQGLMEIGATICTPTSPKCDICPLKRRCVARKHNRQDELPRKRPRPRASEKKVLHHRALWVWRSGKLLLAKRSAKGLFGGLWELPQSERHDDETIGTSVGYRLASRLSPKPIHHEQELSHRRLRIDTVKADASGRKGRKSKASPYTEARWIRLTEASSCGLSSATRRIIADLKEDPEWTTP